MSVIGGTFNPSRVRSFKSTNDLSAKQGFAVALDGSNADSIVLANAQTNEAIGILLNDPTAGDTAKVALFGPTLRVVASAAITKGAKLTPDSGGKLLTTTTPSDKVVAIAMETCTAANDLIEVMLTGGHYYHA